VSRLVRSRAGAPAIGAILPVVLVVVLVVVPVVVLVLVLVLVLAACREEPPSRTSDSGDAEIPYAEYRSAKHFAAGLMHQFEFKEAEFAYLQLMGAYPASQHSRRAHAIAILNQSEPGAQERAIALFDGMIKDWREREGGNAPPDLRASYGKALALLYLGRHEDARDLFIDCARRAPLDAYAAFFAGQCLELEGRFADALEWYRRSIELDEHLRSPLLGAQRCLARLGRESEGAVLLARFVALGEDPRGKLAEFKYTRMGSLGEVEVSVPVQPPRPPTGPLFAEVAPMPIDGLLSGASVNVRPAADLNGDRVVDFLLMQQASGAAAGPLLALSGASSDGGVRWTVAPFEWLPPPAASDAAATLAPAVLLWADFDDDGRTDVAVSPSDGSPGFWLRHREGLRWSRERFEQPIGTEVFRLLAAADLDHDGDVDLLATDSLGSFLLLNRRDGDATRATTWVRRPLEGSVASAASATLGDLDDDGDLDVLLLASDGAAQGWLNDLLWSWRRDPRLEPLESRRPVEAVWFRDDDSGVPVVAMLEGTPANRSLSIWRLERGVPRRLDAGPDASRALGTIALAAIDLAGSGRTNLLLTRTRGDGSLSLEVRDVRAGVIESVEPLPATTSLALPDARGPVLLLGAGEDGRPRWRDAGAGRMQAVAVWFSGRIDPSQQMRTNASGLGTRGDARTVGAWQSRTMLPWRGGASGQPLEPVLYGLGGAAQIDWLSIDWPDGVLQSELDLRPGTRTVVETQRQISSCPVIFAWTGERFEFVTDALGVGGLGYLAGIEVDPEGSLRAVHPPPRPRESVLLGGEGAIAPRDGRFEIRLGEPMEEACYLDAARLVAWDLPPGWSLALDERMGIGGPAPTGEARFFRLAMMPTRATRSRMEDSRLLDVTEAVSAVDGIAADPGAADPRFIGRTAVEWIQTFEFPRSIAGHPGDPALLIDGWVEYPYSSTSFAMWQAAALPEPPSLEALDPATGQWVMLVEHYGYPAGMPRQASFPIPREALPEGCTTLRLRSTNEIYHDRVQVAWFEPCPEAVRRPSPLLAASVAESGFARRPPLPQRRPWYDYDRRMPLWDVRFQFGFYTAFGECTPLLLETDDAVAIFGGGEEVRLEFEAGLPPTSPGWSRAWVLELDGWCKDMDPFTGKGETLEPLPTRDAEPPSPDRDALHERFNTRFAGGR